MLTWCSNEFYVFVLINEKMFYKIKLLKMKLHGIHKVRKKKMINNQYMYFHRKTTLRIALSVFQKNMLLSIE